MKTKYITPVEYKKLSDYDSLGWRPEWLKYKTKKVRQYSDCHECGHREFYGWVEETKGVGEPYRYRYEKPSMMEVMNYHYLKMTLDMWKTRTSSFDGNAGDTITVPTVAELRGKK